MNPLESHCRRQRPSAAKTLLYIGVLPWLTSPPVLARDAALFATTDQNPFIQIYGLPSPAERPMPGPGRWSWAFTFDLASNAIEQEGPSGERIVLSGETYRAGVSLAHRLSERVTVELQAPYIAQSPASWMASFATGTSCSACPTNAPARRGGRKLALEYGYTRSAARSSSSSERVATRLGDICA
jgi:hypothetical protein